MTYTVQPYFAGAMARILCDGVVVGYATRIAGEREMPWRPMEAVDIDTSVDGSRRFETAQGLADAWPEIVREAGQ